MGRGKYFIVVKRLHGAGEENDHSDLNHEKHYKENHSQEHGLPFERFANTLMDDPNFIAYVHKHGYHFTEALAEHVSKHMVNADGSKHFWTSEQVKKAMVSMGFFNLTDPNKTKTQATYGDLTYAANMYYSDGFPDVFKDEASCLKFAWKIANDPDGYDGLFFCRWTSDVIGRSMAIDWKSFI